MTLIDLGDFKIRFDPKEVRISIDGEMIDIGARREESIMDLAGSVKSNLEEKYTPNGKGGYDLKLTKIVKTR